tara:strand:+ start:8096 stop:9373 length:1278 start_codon:yes stop_codon:yes gene_type:complete
MIADLLHAGHIRVINEASKYGDVIIGLMTDEAVSMLDDRAYLKYDQRREALLAIKNVYDIIPQNSASYKDNLKKINPDFVVHGDNWNTGPQSKYREEVIEVLKEIGGQLVEVPYSSEINDVNLKNTLMKLGVTTITRQNRLRELLKIKKTLRILETHNALSALIAENSQVKVNNDLISFDGFWSSSLTDSTSKGKPDIEAVDLTSRLNVINEIFEVTTKPLIFDADTGGKIEHFELSVKSLERLGVSAVVIEDKTGLKKNSLFGNEVDQTQDTIENFCEKIRAGKRSQITDSFMIVARIESLILESGMEDALLRAKSYINAGADGIMIHSRNSEPDEIKEFMKKFRKDDKVTPVVVVPTSFNKVSMDEFEKMGVNIVISANHMLRAAYPAMLRVAESILKNGRTFEAEKDCMSISDILHFVPGTK